MKHTEEQIKKIALRTLKEINFPYDEEVGFYKIRFESQEELIRGTPKNQIIPAWVVSFENGKRIFGENRSVFFTISDETGEPLYIQNSQRVIEIGKDVKGKYYITNPLP